jgi:tetratricopeptide (TPR) repeat protein
VLTKRRFHPWEGGEGLVSGQWVAANVGIARRVLADGRAEDAIAALHAAMDYPANLGEGKHLLTPEHEIHLLLGLAHRAAGSQDAARGWFERAAADDDASTASAAEAVYWRALALRELGDETAATTLLGRLLRAARQRARETVRIDYFATSLPALLLFDEDLDLRNRVECRYLEGLALAGLGRVAAARRAFRDVLDLDRNHAGAATGLLEGSG